MATFLPGASLFFFFLLLFGFLVFGALFIIVVVVVDNDFAVVAASDSFSASANVPHHPCSTYPITVKILQTYLGSVWRLDPFKVTMRRRQESVRSKSRKANFITWQPNPLR